MVPGGEKLVTARAAVTTWAGARFRRRDITGGRDQPYHANPLCECLVRGTPRLYLRPEVQLSRTAGPLSASSENIKGATLVDTWASPPELALSKIIFTRRTPLYDYLSYLTATEC